MVPEGRMFNISYEVDFTTLPLMGNGEMNI